MMLGYMKLVIHHGGYWEENPTMVYVGGKINQLENFDVDLLSFFELQAYSKQWGYNKMCRMWYRLWVYLVVKLLMRYWTINIY